jgi:hypothetical protein
MASATAPPPTGSGGSELDYLKSLVSQVSNLEEGWELELKEKKACEEWRMMWWHTVRADSLAPSSRAR